MLTDSIAIDRVTSGKLSRGAVAQGGMRGSCCADCAGLGDASNPGGLVLHQPTTVQAAIALIGLAGAVWLMWPKKRRRQRHYTAERRTARLPAETMSQVVWERR